MLTLFPGLDEKCTSGPSQVTQATWLCMDLSPTAGTDSTEIHDSHGLPHINMSLDTEIILNRNHAVGTCWRTTRGPLSSSISIRDGGVHAALALEVGSYLSTSVPPSD